ncbi:hypothetical protein [Acinetobacter guillouiae]|uniref:hypothetical protein n=1 Tax=Acinetobacter guillouiae TaxID=106649 RepID=UPI003AF7352C
MISYQYAKKLKLEIAVVNKAKEYFENLVKHGDLSYLNELNDASQKVQLLKEDYLDKINDYSNEVSAEVKKSLEDLNACTTKINRIVRNLEDARKVIQYTSKLLLAISAFGI